MASRAFRQGSDVHLLWAVEGGDTVRVIVSEKARQSFLQALAEPQEIAPDTPWSPWTVEKKFE